MYHTLHVLVILVCVVSSREFLGPIIGGGLTHFLTFQNSASVSIFILPVS